jgi:hypothetical protein
MSPISMLRISVAVGLLLAIGCSAPTLAAPTRSSTESTIVFCSDAGLANCRSAFRAAKRDWLLAASEGVKRATIGRNLKLTLEIQQMHIAAANQSSATNSAEAPPIKRNSWSGFVFDASSVKHSTKPALLIRLGEKIARQTLKRRFAGYDVRYAKGEGCLTCAVITGADGQIEVSFAKDGRTIVDMRSYDERSHDTLGNGVGGSLTKAIGFNSAQCDAGESTTCASPDLKGLLYIVTDDERCPMKVEEERPVVIPNCARIAGFQILSSNNGR